MNEFCEICGVSTDLHDPRAEDQCEWAEAQADRLERMATLFGSVMGR